MHPSRLLSLSALLLVACAALRADSSDPWVGTWASSAQLAAPADAAPVAAHGPLTIRQTIRVSTGGHRLRLQLSNHFGDAPLVVTGAAIARSTGADAINPSSSHPLAFSGKADVTIAAGTDQFSDPFEFELAPLTEYTITLSVADVPHAVTAHPGSRQTSYVAAGTIGLDSPALLGATPVDHWYFISELDVVSPSPAFAIVTFGDSITDGRGTTTNGNNRWPDVLAGRLQADPKLAAVGVLNEGIGGNRIMHPGLGESALDRMDRDVLAKHGVRWIILFEGINDIGSAKPGPNGELNLTADDLIAAMGRIVSRAHAKGIRVMGGSITPFAGFAMYYTDQKEAIRQKVNAWIRSTKELDAVVDFDAAVRSPEQPTMIQPQYDVGDHLHLNPAGYGKLGATVDLTVFQR